MITGAQRSLVVSALSDGSSGDKELEVRVLDVMVECYELWKERHRKYGRGNIAEFGAVGCLIRSSDKKARLREHYLHRVAETSDESIEDSWKDSVNYAVMGLLCHRGLWPGVQKVEAAP